MTTKTFKYICACITFTFFGIYGCVERFTPELTDFQELIIIDGKITNEAPPYTIKVQTSADLSLATPPYLSGCIVTVTSSEGEVEVFEEVSEGNYQSSANGMKGIVGNDYKLEIITPNNKTYQTEYQTLLASKEIDNVYEELEYKYYYDDEADIPGYQFYVDGTKNEEGETNYLWLMEATYKYQADFMIEYEWRGLLKEFPSPDSLRTCYRTFTVKDLSTFSTTEFGNAEFKKIPLNFARADRPPLSIRYSQLVKQYAISAEAYQFWKVVEQQLDGSADLYTTQPYQIRGNIKNINDHSENVLGFFMVAGVTEKRIFVDAPNVQIPDVIPCAFDYETMRFIWLFPENLWPIYVLEGPEGLATMGPGCLDCRDLGGELDAPDFW